MVSIHIVAVNHREDQMVMLFARKKYECAPYYYII